MDGSAPRDLILLADDEGNSVAVNVLGREPRWAAGLGAEIVVRTPFVSGRTNLMLSTSKLERWAAALDKLDMRRGRRLDGVGQGTVHLRPAHRRA